jgi:hypothetical protein
MGWLRKITSQRKLNNIFPPSSPSIVSFLAIGGCTSLPPNLSRQQRWFPLPSLATPVAGERRISFLHLVVRVRINLLWYIVGVVGATSGRINLPQLYSHTDDDIHNGVLKFYSNVCWSISQIGSMVFSLRLAAWSSHCSSNLARSVSWCITDVHRYLRQRWQSGRGDFSGARMLVRKW